MCFPTSLKKSKRLKSLNQVLLFTIEAAVSPEKLRNFSNCSLILDNLEAGESSDTGLNTVAMGLLIKIIKY